MDVDNRDAISDFLDTEEPVHHDITTVDERSRQIAHSENVADNVKEDYDQARRSMKAVISAGTDAVDKLVQVASESEHPRAFEVLANTLKTITEMNESLMNLNANAAELLSQKPQGPENVHNTAVFIGSTEELQKHLGKVINHDD